MEYIDGNVFVSPSLSTKHQRVLGQYQQMDALKEKGIIKSEVLEGFQISLEDLF
ncbi:hypothetical protein [Neobacillus soli]|uniref:hypothetical protein n=1 Tax=Neobacillus soli TaxID=220688 RepID=UPI000B0B8CB4|nr:hypothetical protein [Neobacillus soli]